MLPNQYRPIIKMPIEGFIRPNPKQEGYSVHTQSGSCFISSLKFMTTRVIHLFTMIRKIDQATVFNLFCFQALNEVIDNIVIIKNSVIVMIDALNMIVGYLWVQEFSSCKLTKVFRVPVLVTHVSADEVYKNNPFLIIIIEYSF